MMVTELGISHFNCEAQLIYLFITKAKALCNEVVTKSLSNLMMHQSQGLFKSFPESSSMLSKSYQTGSRCLKRHNLLELYKF